MKSDTMRTLSWSVIVSSMVLEAGYSFARVVSLQMVTVTEVASPKISGYENALEMEQNGRVCIYVFKGFSGFASLRLFGAQWVSENMNNNSISRLLCLDIIPSNQDSVYWEIKNFPKMECKQQNVNSLVNPGHTYTFYMSSGAAQHCG